MVGKVRMRQSSAARKASRREAGHSARPSVGLFPHLMVRPSIKMSSHSQKVRLMNFWKLLIKFNRSRDPYNHLAKFR